MNNNIEKLINLWTQQLELIDKLIEQEAVTFNTEDDNEEQQKDSPSPTTNSTGFERRITFGQIRRMLDYHIDMRSSIITSGTWNPQKDVSGNWTISEKEFCVLTGLSAPVDPNQKYFYAPRTIETLLDAKKGSLSARLTNLAQKNSGLNGRRLGGKWRYDATDIDRLVEETLENRKPSNILLLNNFMAAAKEKK